MPTMAQTGSYSGTLHYLKAVQAAGTFDTLAVMDRMRALPVEDTFVRNGVLRADGRVVKEVWVGRLKTASESKAEWDYVELLQTVPGSQAFRPVADSRCPLLRA